MNKLKVNFSVEFIANFLIILGIIGLSGTFFNIPGEVFWKYFWPVLILFTGIIFTKLYLDPKVTSSQKVLGIFLGGTLIFYSLFFYLTILLELRWTFLLIFLVIILGATTGLQGIGTEERKRQRKYGYFIDKFTDPEDRKGEEMSRTDVEIEESEENDIDTYGGRSRYSESGKQADKERKEYDLLDKENYDTYYAMDNLYSNEEGNPNPVKLKILKTPLGFLGIFSVFFLTFTYIDGNYTSVFYPLVLLGSGIYIKRKLSEWKRRVV